MDRTMSFIALPHGHLIVLRAHSTQRLNISEAQLSALLDEVPLLSDKRLVLVGPVFGGEVVENLRQCLDAAGFVYFDDYFCIEPQNPEWCSFGVCLSENSDPIENLSQQAR